jgi:hypothetical protein
VRGARVSNMLKATVEVVSGVADASGILQYVAPREVRGTRKRMVESRMQRTSSGTTTVKVPSARVSAGWMQ